MLTIRTQVAISILHAITSGQNAMPMNDILSINIVSELLEQLEVGGIVRHIPNKDKVLMNSYELTRPVTEISLLDILEATREHLNCNHPTTEEFYTRYANAAKKLGVVNHMTRLYLEEIKLMDL